MSELQRELLEAGMIGHRLLTPVSGLRGALTRLSIKLKEEGLLNDETEKELEEIGTGISELQEAIQDLIDFTKQKKGGSDA